MTKEGFTKHQQFAFDFCLKYLPEYKEMIERQIENATIEADYSPHYCILTFKYAVPPISINDVKFNAPVSLIVSNNSSNAKYPIEFLLHFSEGVLEQFEYYSADLGSIDIIDICTSCTDIELRFSFRLT